MKELAILLVIVGVVGAIVVASGVFPVKASDGHWAITTAILEFASRRSVSFNSRGIDVPPLDEEGMVRLGAATYESNCRACHGRPGLPSPAVPARMTPPPPLFPDDLSEWESRELFYIVKHGIKFTGMPAWPTQQRDEDVWPLVAFLHAFREIDEESYLRLVRPSGPNESETLRLVTQACSACHGNEAVDRSGPRVPVLRGQSKEYLEGSLLAYREGTRHSGVMKPIAARLSDAEITDLADHYASISAPARRANVAMSESDDAEYASLIEEGYRLSTKGDAKKKIPSCADCHGPGGQPRADEYPTLVGQPSWYIENQLRLFVSRARGGTENANLMHPVADKLTSDQIKALAEYYSQVTEE